MDADASLNSYIRFIVYEPAISLACNLNKEIWFPPTNPFVFKDESTTLFPIQIINDLRIRLVTTPNKIIIFSKFMIVF